MHGNSKLAQLLKATDALKLAEACERNGDTVTAEMWRREYDKYMRRYLGIR